MASRKIGKVTVNTNIDLVLSELDKVNGLPDRIWASVYSNVEYAVFVEFGTYKMKPHAMIRRSEPAIKAYFDTLLSTLPMPPTEADLLKLVNDTVDFALTEIRRNTPRKSGTLQDSWKKEEASSG